MAAATTFLMHEQAAIEPAKLIEDAQSYTRDLSPARINSASVDLMTLDGPVQREWLGRDDLYESWLVLFRSEVRTEVHRAVADWLQRLGFDLSAAAARLDGGPGALGSLRVASSHRSAKPLPGLSGLGRCDDSGQQLTERGHRCWCRRQSVSRISMHGYRRGTTTTR